MNKRQMIEAAIINMINEKIISVGDAVPSIRKMARRYDISITPVIEAYRNLELHGILKSRSKSGFVVVSAKSSDLKKIIPDLSNFSDTHSVLTNELKSFSSEKAAGKQKGEQQKKFYDFNCPTLTPAMIPFDSINQHIIKALRSQPQLINTNPHGYDDPMLVDSIAWCMAHYQCIINKREICITNNDFTLPLVFALKACLSPNQAILLTAPADKCHISAARQTGHEVFYINNTVEYGLDLDILERILIKTPHIGCIIVSPNFQPPSGKSMSVEAKSRLAEICARYGVCIIEDDRNRHLALRGYSTLPIKSMAPDDTIYIQSLSFPVMPHLQIHWTCPGKYTKSFRAHRDRALAAPLAFIQRSFSYYMDSGQHKKDIFSIGEQFCETASLVREALVSAFPDGTYISAPEGGCTIWIELPKSINSNVLADIARINGISISVGQDYNSKDNSIIINFSTIVEDSKNMTGIYLLGGIACKLATDNESVNKTPN